MRTALLITCLLGTVACGDTITWLDLPVDDARSAILLVQRADESELIAQDIDSQASLLREVSAIQRIDGLFPKDSLQELGLEEGPIATLEGGVPMPPQPAFVLNTAADEPVWQASERPPELQVPLIEHPDPCVRFVRQWIRAMDAVDDANFYVRLGAESLLVSAYNGEVFHLLGTDLRRLTTEPEQPIISAADQSEAGVVWMGGPRGQIWQAELQVDGPNPRAVLTTATITPSKGRVLRIVAEPSPSTAIVTIDVSGLVARWDGQTWTVLYDYDRRLFSASRLVFDDEGSLWVSTDESVDILRITGDRAVRSSPEDLVNGVPALALLPDFGITAVSSGGDIFHRSGEGWNQLQGSPIRVNTYAIHRFSSGLIYGGVLGVMGQYRQPNDFCPEQRVGQGSIKFIVPYQEALLLISDGPSGGAPALELVTTEF